MESAVRREAVESARFAVVQGGATKAEAAEDLGLNPRTLRRWEARLEAQRPPWTPLGRRLWRSSPKVRGRLILTAKRLGAGLGIRRLAGWFPEMPRSEVEQVILRYRWDLSMGKPVPAGDLHWLLPGSVWAMDFTRAPYPVDGLWRVVFSVRDVASGAQLVWQPVAGESAQAIVPVLGNRFETCGAPLVVKSDLGSAFSSGDCQRFLEDHGVKLLFSPPRTPRYNGSAEVGIRWQKLRTETAAAEAGRPGHWRSEDLERAMSRTNAYAPRGGQSRLERWEARTPIPETLRDAFLETVAAEEPRVRAEREYPPEGPLGRAGQRLVERTAIRRALVAHGLLAIRRRFIPKPILRPKADKAS